MFQPRLLSYNLVDVGQFRWKIGLMIRLIIRLIILQQQQLGKKMSVNALFEAVSSKFLSAGSFLLRGDVRIQGNTEGKTPSLNSFFPGRDFLISPSLKCREHI